MPRTKKPGPERTKRIFLRVTEHHHRLAGALATRLGMSVQDTFEQMLAETAKALRVDVPVSIPKNQLALAFSRKRQPLRGPSRGARGATRRGKGKTRKKQARSKRVASSKTPATVAAA
jgi:hypothetical protein